MTDAVYRDGKYIHAPAPLPPSSRHPFLHFKLNSHQLSIHVSYILPSVLLLGTGLICGTWTGTHCRVRSENIRLNSLQPRLTQGNELLLAGGLTFVQPAVHADCHTGKMHRTLAVTKTQPAQTRTSQRSLKKCQHLTFLLLTADQEKQQRVKGVETERMDESQLMTATHVYASFLAHVINTPAENT